MTRASKTKRPKQPDRLRSIADGGILEPMQTIVIRMPPDMRRALKEKAVAMRNEHGLRVTESDVIRIALTRYLSEAGK